MYVCYQLSTRFEPTTLLIPSADLYTPSFSAYTSIALALLKELLQIHLCTFNVNKPQTLKLLKSDFST